MTRRERKMRERKKDIVVFLDVNISLITAIHLEDLHGLAHWVSFGVFRELPKEMNGDNKHRLPRIRCQRIKDFFDRIGDLNLFAKGGSPPNRMNDYELLSYMARFMEELYPGRKLYIFFTHDKKFLTQSLMEGHPQLFLFISGKLVYVALDTPVEKGMVSETADEIRKNFLRRLDELAF